MRTKEAAAAADNNPSNLARAAGTSLPGTIIGQKLLRACAGCVPAATKVEQVVVSASLAEVQRLAGTEPDGVAQHSPDGSMQAADFRAGETTRRSRGVNAGAEEGFGQVDVAQSAHPTLVQQPGLDRLSRFPAARGEMGDGEVGGKRLGTEAVKNRGVQGQPAESAWVLEYQPLFPKVEHHVGVAGQGLAGLKQVKPPSHAQMGVQRELIPVSREFEHQPFAPAFHGAKPGSLQGGYKSAGRNAPHTPGIPHPDRAHGLPLHPRGKMTRQNLDFREFGHRAPCGRRRAYSLTSVPTFSPRATRRRLCGLNRSNTMMGIRLSMHMENAVESMTCSRLASASE